MQKTYLVHLVTEVYRIYVVCFQIGEHDNLAVLVSYTECRARYRKRTINTAVNINTATHRTEKRNKSQPARYTHNEYDEHLA